MRKLKRFKFNLTILLLSVLPASVCFIVVNLAYSLFAIIFTPHNFMDNLGLMIFCILVGIIYILLIADMNIFSYSRLKKVGNSSNSVELSRIDKGLGLTKVGIYLTIINIIYAVLAALMLYSMRVQVAYILICFLALSFLPGAILLTFPLAAYVSIIIGVIISILALVNYLFILNGTVRLIIASKVIREKTAMYLFLSLIPIVNLFSSLALCKKAKQLLKENNLKVGVFGAKFKEI
ncbi:hypothetical protein [Clostridium manihotivorum]|nr:hypothetical protein [Clostridium manihotivorum]